MSFQNQVEAVAEIGSKMYAENERLRREIEMLTSAGVIEVAVRNPSVAEYMKHLEARAESAEAERDRLRPLTFCGCGDQFRAHDPGTCGACLAGATCGKEIDKRVIERLTADRDRYRDALIACRPAALRDFDRYRMMVRTEEAKRIAALLNTIDAAAKGQG